MGSGLRFDLVGVETEKNLIFSACMTQDTQHKIRIALSFVERNESKMCCWKL